MASRRHGTATGLWLAALFFASWYPALSETNLAATKGDIPCPSREFSKFIVAFTEDVRVQRTFARFPLEYRYVDAALVGTKEESSASKKRMIPSFEKSPFRFGEKKTVKLFPNEIERKKSRLEIKQMPSSNKET